MQHVGPAAAPSPDLVGGPRRVSCPRPAHSHREQPVEWTRPFTGFEVAARCRFEDVVVGRRDDETWSAGAATEICGPVMGEHVMVGMDGPDHRTHRALASPVFRRKVPDRWVEAQVRPVLEALVDTLGEGADRSELVLRFTATFPWAIASILGLPSEDWLRLLLPAGVERTYRSSGSVLFGLLNDPDRLDAVRDDPSRLPTAIEEGLRWATPVLITTRVLPLATGWWPVSGPPTATGHRGRTQNGSACSARLGRRCRAGTTRTSALGCTLPTWRPAWRSKSSSIATRTCAWMPVTTIPTSLADCSARPRACPSCCENLVLRPAPSAVRTSGEYLLVRDLGPPHLRFQCDDSLAWWVIDRPEAGTLTAAMYLGIGRAVDEVNASTSLAAPIITGTGDVFAPGREMADAELRGAAIQTAGEILQTAPEAGMHFKRGLRAGYGVIDQMTFAASIRVAECAEGFAAFCDRRSPSWVPKELRRNERL